MTNMNACKLIWWLQNSPEEADGKRQRKTVGGKRKKLRRPRSVGEAEQSRDEEAMCSAEALQSAAVSLSPAVNTGKKRKRQRDGNSTLQCMKSCMEFLYEIV